MRQSLLGAAGALSGVRQLFSWRLDSERRCPLKRQKRSAPIEMRHAAATCRSRGMDQPRKINDLGDLTPAMRLAHMRHAAPAWRLVGGSKNA